MVIVDKGRWTRKPLPTEKVEIDWSHPSANGLIHCYLLNQGGVVRDLVRGNPSGALEGTSVWGAGIGGVGIVTPAGDSVSGANFGEGGISHPNADFSVMLRCVPIESAIAGKTFGRITGTGLDAYHWDMDVGNFNFILSTVVVIDSTIAVTLNDSYSIGMAYKRLTECRFSVRDFTASTLAEATVANTSAPTAVTGVSAVLGRHSSGTTNFRGSLFFTFLWSRQLPFSEMRALHAEPYAFLRPVLRRTYFVGGTAAAQLEALVSASSSLIADLTTAIEMAALASSSGNILADLTTAIQMDGLVSASASMTADLSVGAAQLEGVIGCAANASADLSTAIEITAGISAAGGIAADLSTSIEMSAAVSAHGDASADLTTQIELAAALVASAQTIADLKTAIEFEAMMAANGLLIADLTTAIQLEAAALGEAFVLADLTGGTPPPFVKSRHQIIAPVEDRAVKAPTEDRSIRAPV